MGTVGSSPSLRFSKILPVPPRLDGIPAGLPPHVTTAPFGFTSSTSGAAKFFCLVSPPRPSRGSPGVPLAHASSIRAPTLP